MLRKSQEANEDTKLLIQFYQDKLELEKETLSAQQRSGYTAKIGALQAQIDFNAEFIRYTKPLL